MAKRSNPRSTDWWNRRLRSVRTGVDKRLSAGSERLAALRGRSVVADIGWRTLERDREAAGTLLGSALALRLFLFFIPMVLAFVGVVGILGTHTELDSASEVVGITGTLANEIDGTFDQSGATPWIALVSGLFFMAWTGRSLTKALVISSALSWRLRGRQKTPVRVIGVVVGIVVAASAMAIVVNRIRIALGLAVASVSLGAVLVAQLVLWTMLFLTLPRSTTDPGAALPGAAIVATVTVGLQAISQLYLPAKVEGASSLYGAIGIATALLGWFFIIGRAISFALAVNAATYDRIGSVSQRVFALPILRAIPRRFGAVARLFDLDGDPD